jgi:hypothetical protein
LELIFSKTKTACVQRLSDVFFDGFRHFEAAVPSQNNSFLLFQKIFVCSTKVLWTFDQGFGGFEHFLNFFELFWSIFGFCEGTVEFR